MISFKDSYLVESEYKEYVIAIDRSIQLLESEGSLNEGLLDTFTDKVKDGIDFIKKFAELVNGKLIDLLKVFKDKVLFTFFSKIKWSITELVSLVKQGYKLWKQLHDIIAKYIAETGVVKWTNEQLTKLDDF